jgi:hypothetical protein
MRVVPGCCLISFRRSDVCEMHAWFKAPTMNAPVVPVLPQSGSGTRVALLLAPGGEAAQAPVTTNSQNQVISQNFPYGATGFSHWLSRFASQVGVPDSRSCGCEQPGC